MQQFRDVVASPLGRPIPGATITVTKSGGGTPTLYSDNGTTALGSNVLTSDAGGEYRFYALNGRYTLTIVASGYTTTTRDEVLWDPADRGPDLYVFGAAVNGTDSDSAALALAAAWSNTNKRTVFIPPGVTVHASGAEFSEAFVSFAGAGMPTRDASDTELLGGSVIRGKFVFRGSNISITDLGVDRGSAHNASTSDALVLSNASGSRAHVQNVMALGRDPADVAHAILIEGFAHLTGGNTVGVNNHFGHAIKVQRSNFGNITSVANAGMGLIVKHDKDYNGTGKSVFGNVLVVGTGATEFAAQVLCLNTGAAALEMRDISIGDVVFTGCQYGAAVVCEKGSSGDAVMDNIRFGNITGSATVAGFYTYAYTGGFIGTVAHGDLLFTPSGNSAGVASYDGVFQVITGKTVAAMPSGTTRTTDAITVGSGVYRYTSDGISLPIAYTATNAGVTFGGTEGRVEGICAFESYGSVPIRRQGLRSPGTPTTGRYVAGEFLWNNGPALDGSNMSILGWSRITTGTGHTMGTDWARAYISHVSPAT